MVPRRKSIPVNVGGVVIGGAAPIAVQTMTKTDTRDVKATLRQIHELKDALYANVKGFQLAGVEYAKTLIESEPVEAKVGTDNVGT